MGIQLEFICKNTLIILLSSISYLNILAQQPIKWRYNVKKINEKNFEIHLTAIIDDGWHIYAQKQPSDAIAIPTKIKFDDNPLVTLNGKIKEVGVLKKHSISEIGVTQFEYSGKVDFIQFLELRSTAKTRLSGKILFQVCTDAKCLPAKEEIFELDL